MDITTLLRDDLPPPRAIHPTSAKYRFDNGDNDPEAVPVSELARIASEVIFEHGERLASYHLGGSPLGWLPLRRQLAQRLSKAGDYEVGEDEILVLSGSSQGLELLFAALVKPTDTVLVEEFSYSAALRKLERTGAALEAVKLSRSGIDIPALESQIERLHQEGRPPSILYTIPTVQNPTGTTMSLCDRYKIVELSRKYNFYIIEDECYADLMWSDDRPPSIYSLAPDCCVLLGSLSKTLVPALRLGFIVAPTRLQMSLLSLKGDGGTSGLSQMIAAKFLESQFDDHVVQLRSSLEAKCNAAISAFEECFGVSAEIQRPSGGMFLWVKLDDGIDASCLVSDLMLNKVLINDGADWSVDKINCGNYIRFCFASHCCNEIINGIKFASFICKDKFNLPVCVGNIK